MILKGFFNLYDSMIPSAVKQFNLYHFWQKVVCWLHIKLRSDEEEKQGGFRRKRRNVHIGLLTGEKKKKRKKENKKAAEQFLSLLLKDLQKSLRAFTSSCCFSPLPRLWRSWDRMSPNTPLCCSLRSITACIVILQGSSFTVDFWTLNSNLYKLFINAFFCVDTWFLESAKWSFKCIHFSKQTRSICLFGFSLLVYISQ